MNNTPDNLNETLSNTKVTQVKSVIYLVIVAVFSVIILFRLFSWSNGLDNFRGILAPIAIVSGAVGALIRPRSKTLSYVFTVIALILLIIGIVTMIIY